MYICEKIRSVCITYDISPKTAHTYLYCSLWCLALWAILYWKKYAIKQLSKTKLL